MIRLICLTLFNDISRRRLVTLNRIEKLNLQESDRVVVNIWKRARLIGNEFWHVHVKYSFVKIAPVTNCIEIYK